MYPDMPTCLLNSKNTRENLQNTELSSRDITNFSVISGKWRLKRYKLSYKPRWVADMLDTGGDNFPVVTLLTGTVQGSPA